METTSIPRRILMRLDFRTWAWWQAPVVLRCYVALVTMAAVCLIGFAASQTRWTVSDLVKFILLSGCGMATVVATPRIQYGVGVNRDFLSAWVLPVAILLPPVYAMLAPIPLQFLTQKLIHRGTVYRRVFTVAAMGQCYAAASLVFRAFPASVAGGAIGTGTHVLTWVLVVILCELVGGRGHHFLIVAGIKLTDRSVRLVDLELNRDALQGDFAESDLGILISIVVGVNAVLAIVAVPMVLMIRRFVMHAELLAKTRIDTKTGLLNSSTWENEAKIEVERAIRTRSPISVALIDIDHFKAVNDTHGHLVGDKVLRAVTDAIQEHLRSYDLAGRFGGEEFVVLLPQAREADAISIAERLRTHVAAMAIPIADDMSDEHVRLTVSVGVASLNAGTRELNDLMATADAAMYIAKQSGRNRTHAISDPDGASDSTSNGPGDGTSEGAGDGTSGGPGAASPTISVPRPRLRQPTTPRQRGADLDEREHHRLF
jgi:diguanylate cyclase (GGDEF)-like protein